MLAAEACLTWQMRKVSTSEGLNNLSLPTLLPLRFKVDQFVEISCHEVLKRPHTLGVYIRSQKFKTSYANCTMQTEAAEGTVQ